MARFEHENKVRRKELKPEKNGIHLFLESGIHCAGIWNPVPGIRNPQHGIQNPRLSWIPLHGRLLFVFLNIMEKLMFNRLVYFLDKHIMYQMIINLVFVVDAPLLRLLCLSLIKSKEPLKTKYTPAGYFWTYEPVSVRSSYRVLPTKQISLVILLQTSFSKYITNMNLDWRNSLM